MLDKFERVINDINNSSMLVRCLHIAHLISKKFKVLSSPVSLVPVQYFKPKKELIFHKVQKSRNEHITLNGIHNMVEECKTRICYICRRDRLLVEFLLV